VALGFNPVFVDCNRETFQSDLAQFASRATSSTVGIMPVHIYGQVTEDMIELCNWAKEKGYFIIEDCAQAFGAEINGTGAGRFGDLAVFSSYSDKALPTGEGGLISAIDPELFRMVKLQRNQGRENSGTFTHESLGMNFRITDMQAAVGVHFLERYSEELQRRRKIYNIYRQHSELMGIETMTVYDVNSMVPFRFPVVSNNFEKTKQNLESNGFQTRGFFVPLHRQPKFIEFTRNSLPNSEDISTRGFCLPVHSLVSEAVIEKQLRCIV
jgi:perosamine synthetase